jgi:hypothetical protein
VAALVPTFARADACVAAGDAGPCAALSVAVAWGAGTSAVFTRAVDDGASNRVGAGAASTLGRSANGIGERSTTTIASDARRRSGSR